MAQGRFTVFIKRILRVSICVMFSILAVEAFCDTDDDDTLLEFYWGAADGSVDHYNVYMCASTDKYTFVEGDYVLVGSTDTPDAPTQGSPYGITTTMDDGERDGRAYRVKVVAEDGNGIPGPESEPSDVVWRMRSPGYQTGPTEGDADANLRVSAGDWAILCLAWGTQRQDGSFDYRADVDYDYSVGLSDMIIIASNWGIDYNGGGGAAAPPVSFPPVASSSKCRIRLVGRADIRIGDEISVDIVVEGAEDIYAVDFQVSFDPALVKVEGMERGEFFPASGGSAIRAGGLRQSGDLEATSWIAGEMDQSRGRIGPTLVGAPPGSSAGESGDGVIARLKLSAVSSGVSSISLKNIHAYDSQLKPIAATPIDVVFSVEAAKNLLEQNYPNPFNPETWIPYALAEESDRVTVTIYSALGEEIRRLELGHKKAGFYTAKDRAVYWDGKNEDGISVASGVYFYQIKAGEFSAVRKMVVLR